MKESHEYIIKNIGDSTVDARIIHRNDDTLITLTNSGGGTPVQLRISDLEYILKRVAWLKNATAKN